MATQYAIFVVNLLQDVNIIRPLVYMASRDLGMRTEFLVTKQFYKRDKSSVWKAELQEISKATGTPLLPTETPMDSIKLLQNKAGVLVAGSESSLSAHKAVHDIFRCAPSSLLKITLQHGYECVGFLHNKAHDQAYGRNVTFAADVICSWSARHRLSATGPAQAAKVFVTGSTGMLQICNSTRMESESKPGLVCENMHSVRLNTGGNFKTSFMQIFEKFSNILDENKLAVTLRPHPGGQYVLKTNAQISSNVIINNNPIYKVDLSRFAYGISAPSSILIDMIVAGIPVAVWRDETGIMDTSNYQGLTEISTLEDWVEFSREAVSNPSKYLALQTRFLEHLQMPTDPEWIYRRYAGLFLSTKQRLIQSGKGQEPEPERVLFIANGMDPTLQLCLLRPLDQDVKAGTMAIEIITGEQMSRQFGKNIEEPVVQAWLDNQISMFRPSLIVFCRYNGYHAAHIVELARKQGIPVIYHMDDDLLNVPLHLGQKKYETHNAPHRLATVRYLLDHADLVYCSTRRLQDHFAETGVQAPLVSGQINCAGSLLAPPSNRKVRKLGYMGFDKSHELELLLPVIVTYLRKHPDVEFHLFGTFTLPAVLEEFDSRIKLLAPNRNYDDFLTVLSLFEWDIGICPLARTPFNLKKSNNKWVEYTSVGTSVIASKGTVYDECCADGCGILVDTGEEWLDALEKLTNNPDIRFEMVNRAQVRLLAEYSIDQHREQVLSVFAQAKSSIITDGNLKTG